MRFRHRRADELEEGESYYVSMTDLMVGVLFIFIIMLAYFALHFQATTTELTSAKDAQTTALLQVAKNLESKTVMLEIDYDTHVVCIPGQVLTEDGTGTDKRCFAYTGTVPVNPADEKKEKVEAAQAMFSAALSGDLQRKNVTAAVSLTDGSTVYDADRLFVPGTANLSSEGQTMVAETAASLAQRLPCFAYGAPASNCEGDEKMSAVVILGTANINAATAEGRAAQALSLERSVVFHKALMAAQPVLGKLTNHPAGGEPLLRVVSIGNSSDTAPAAGVNKTVVIQFQMAQ
ncbi:hypothetical protein [Asticcacaulis sp. YBE204]|uniref:hypothetical protein n=1 Tax=Asticcacaulis sp. YBE204 TaxID=1282363 RepID=UPI0003C40507|nr:hypothetical protein [Asticcacaulis sp. YBE204]ESQ80776.1 hypothetical protein AEYBE204_00200 [Asticcacaulis sp. YBE204]